MVNGLLAPFLMAHLDIFSENLLCVNDNNIPIFKLKQKIYDTTEKLE